MDPIRNSDLSKFRLMVEGREVDEKFLRKYLMMGQLLDALITEPECVDTSLLRLKLSTRYDEHVYIYDPEQMQLAIFLRDSFLAHPIGGKFATYGKKRIFSTGLSIQDSNGKLVSVPTEGEGDLIIKACGMGCDIKITSAETSNDFFKKVDELYYDQQGCFYMDNMGLDRFAICGVSRKATDDNGKAKVFVYPIKRGDQTFQKGKERYLHWMLRYLDHYKLWNELKPAA
jgi:hypothetical protein